MSDENPVIPESLRPDPDDYSFDLLQRLDSIVSVRTRIPDHAMTAPMLGTERAGHGVVINDEGLVVTIGYVITEADSVWLVTNTGVTLQAHVVGYDQQSGFGLVQALGKLDISPVTLGNSGTVGLGQRMLVAGSGGIEHCTRVLVSGIREFAGYWEYLLQRAFFTSPAHPFWGGTALLGENGNLYGIGSLIVQAVDSEGQETSVNMMIPIDELTPILDELILYGRRNEPPRPWMGWFVQDTETGPVVAGVVDSGPAESAGLASGDEIVSINDESVADLASVHRAVWAAGEAGTRINVAWIREGEQQQGTVSTADRNTRMSSASVH
ncbi:MAG: S1C family serine protease [Gammaproteobacteria bacterium]|nr:S1C family serine protease [Gammaproteobacteria bacterium]